ncbi:pyridoxal phosphate-dependent transferase [Radiomyces spectabilis]|uniref:pyridoxal phosphate-dependent transferase n=1 Tax=Radiomyces spectabilis TaxID=64574 RepID=UPI00221F471E|nr:pyridoxal phosphate-dependent transferase [Radiomyces spectabilis]KAI8376544.1 pyridoxal phosphate-dependent transferase [Radiomyces spectabilis]
MPSNTIQELAKSLGYDLLSVDFANALDKQDKLAHFRDEFAIPIRRQVSGDHPVVANESDLDEPCTYLCGNSLGLMPKRARKLVEQEFDAWAQCGVEGHWNHPYNRPWAVIDEAVKDSLARVVGAKPIEVSPMNTLTANVHFMLVSFYRPTDTRFKILIESKAFPSDHYAVVSHLHSRGIDPAVGLITVSPREGESTLRTEDIIDVIQKNNDIALVMLSGVQYYTGQYFEMEKITKAAHDAGCMVGWDLAHAVGNVPLKLHDWNVDFACWCSYKYLNSGPGAIAGTFIHEKYAHDSTRPRYAGWWGNEKSTRFEMAPEFRPSEGAAGYQLSNPSIFPTTCLLGSLQLFDEAGMDQLRAKSVLLTSYLETLLLTVLKDHQEAGHFRILTPVDPEQRGCQLSLEFPEKMLQVFAALQARGVVCDERKPTVIRISPAPLYNSFNDVLRVVTCLKEAMNEIFK